MLPLDLYLLLRPEKQRRTRLKHTDLELQRLERQLVPASRCGQVRRLHLRMSESPANELRLTLRTNFRRRLLTSRAMPTGGRPVRLPARPVQQKGQSLDHDRLTGWHSEG